MYAGGESMAGGKISCAMLSAKEEYKPDDSDHDLFGAYYHY